MRRFPIALPLLLASRLFAVDQPSAPPEPPRITLTWSTASEMDNYGFLVMRADDEKGPFTAVNPKLLPGGGNSDVPLEYRFVDENVVPGKAYWYFLESVSTTGVHEKFSPALKKVCCKAPRAKTGAGGTKDEPKDGAPAPPKDAGTAKKE